MFLPSCHNLIMCGFPGPTLERILKDIKAGCHSIFISSRPTTNYPPLHMGAPPCVGGYWSVLQERASWLVGYNKYYKDTQHLFNNTINLNPNYIMNILDIEARSKKQESSWSLRAIVYINLRITCLHLNFKLSLDKIFIFILFYYCFQYLAKVFN